jgi:hypothetical protein
MKYAITCLIFGLAGALSAHFIGAEIFTLKWFVVCFPWWLTGGFVGSSI